MVRLGPGHDPDPTVSGPKDDQSGRSVQGPRPDWVQMEVGVQVEELACRVKQPVLQVRKCKNFPLMVHPPEKATETVLESVQLSEALEEVLQQVVPEVDLRSGACRGQ